MAGLVMRGPARCEANKLVGISGQQLSGGSSAPLTMTVGLLIKHISQRELTANGRHSRSIVEL